MYACYIIYGLAKSVLALCYLHEQIYIRARSLRSVHSRMDGTTDKCVDCPRLRLRKKGAFRGGSTSAIDLYNLLLQFIITIYYVAIVSEKIYKKIFFTL